MKTTSQSLIPSWFVSSSVVAGVFGFSDFYGLFWEFSTKCTYFLSLTSWRCWITFPYVSVQFSLEFYAKFWKATKREKPLPSHAVVPLVGLPSLLDVWTLTFFWVSCLWSAQTHRWMEKFVKLGLTRQMCFHLTVRKSEKPPEVNTKTFS